jgi:hypothetical protein
MRPLEVLLVVADLVAFLLLVVPLPGRAGWLRHGALIVLPVLGVQLLVEGPLAAGPGVRAGRAVRPDLAAADQQAGGQARRTKVDQANCRGPGRRAGDPRPGRRYPAADDPRRP